MDGPRQAIDELIDELQAQVVARPDAAAEVELVRLRHEAFDDVARAAPVPVPAITASGSPTDAPSGPIPTVGPDELGIDVLRRSLASHGALRVDGLIGPDRVAELVAGIDRALEACDAGLAGAPVAETSPWFVPFEATPGRGYRKGGRRSWMRASGGVWTADSPRMMVSLVQLLEETGVGALAAELLGERPALSANKCNLRRTPPGECGDWHQDGSFLGVEARSLNLWLALSPCGVDAPTMDVVPRRFDHVVETGTEGARFDWSVSPSMAEAAAGEAGIVRPSYQPGDAMLFDHLFLHRTAASPDMPNDRYAMETWMFAPSAYPEGQIPLVW